MHEHLHKYSSLLGTIETCCITIMWELAIVLFFVVRYLIKTAVGYSIWSVTILIGLVTILLLYNWKFILYHGKLILFYMLTYSVALVLMPISLCRPRSLKNAALLASVLRHCTQWMNIEYKIRGKEHLMVDRGAIVCANHQESLDALGVVMVWPLLDKLLFLVKSSLLYNLGGFSLWLCGFSFISQSGGKKTIDEINAWIKRGKKEKFKVWIYPEGTRNRHAVKTQTLLPFRKGAFAAAIIAQVPIIPIVFSPYYFCIQDIYYRSSGKIIVEALPAVSTKGLTLKDIDMLSAKVRKVMSDKFKEFHAEVMRSLPEDHPVFQHINRN